MRSHLRFWVAAAGLLAFQAAALAGGQAPSSHASGVTYTKDVAPILYKNCVECHRPTMFAPMSLMSYDEVRPWARAIKQRVARREMPPWDAEGPRGVFKNDPRLSQQDIDTIAAWVDSGAAKGAEADMPPAPTFRGEGWTIGTPDYVVTMDAPFPIPADGTVPYLYFRIPLGLDEDHWIQAYEFRPERRAQVHHIVASIVPSDATTLGERTGGLGNLVPSRPGVVLPDGVAKLLPAHSDLVLQMHYTTNGRAATDQTSVGFIWAKKPPKMVEGSGGGVTELQFVIPPFAPDYEVKGTRTLQEDTTVLAMMPHMHVRGKDMTYIAHYPDGRSETLLSVPKYDFNWQTTYEYETPKVLPKGTKIEVIAHFDNSPGNKDNPDPTHEVRWGDQTWEEMMIGSMVTLQDRDAAGTRSPASGGDQQ